MNENLSFEFCQPPAELLRGGGIARHPLTKFIWEAPVNQWIKVEGYADAQEVRNAQNSINGSKATTFKPFKAEGINLKTRTDTKNLVMYVCKEQK